MTGSGPIKVTNTIKRVDQKWIDVFRGKPVGHIVDALGRKGALDHRIKPVGTACRFIGSALPVDAGPRDNLAPWAALKRAQAGDILMIATGGYESAAVTGDLMIGMTRNAGVTAVVTDGVVRDLEGIQALGIPVFAVGINPNSPQKNGPGSVGLPIVIGGVGVAAGDLVIGSEEGVVVIPSSRLEEAEREIGAITLKENSMEEAVRQGASQPQWLADIPFDELFTQVD